MRALSGWCCNKGRPHRGQDTVNLWSRGWKVLDLQELLGRHDRVLTNDVRVKLILLICGQNWAPHPFITDNHNQSVTFLETHKENKQASDGLNEVMQFRHVPGHPFARAHGGRCWQFERRSGGREIWRNLWLLPGRLSRVFSQQSSQQSPHNQCAELPLTVS